MAKSNNHKMALLYMMQELLRGTDEDHALNASELIKALEKYDCEADRRTIYSNVEILQDFGIDVIKKENGQGYYIGSRDFELPELKLLVDSVQSSKFITEKKSRELIGKLMQLTNDQKAKQLNRSVFIRNRMKTGNENVYYNVEGNEKRVTYTITNPANVYIPYELPESEGGLYTFNFENVGSNGIILYADMKPSPSSGFVQYYKIPFLD